MGTNTNQDNFGDDIRYCDELGKWYVWNGVKWDAAGKTGPQAKMQRAARMIKAEAELIEAKNNSEEATAKTDKERNQVLAWAGGFRGQPGYQRCHRTNPYYARHYK